MSSSSGQGRGQTEEECQRNRSVWLAAAPLSKSSGLAIKSSSITSDGIAKIPWQSFSDLGQIPTILANYVLTMHVAVFVINDEDRYDPDYTIIEKLKKATFWEHGGSSSTVDNGDRMRWDEDTIRKISAAQEIGKTDLSDEKISQQFYRKLRQDWDYFPVWWNCHDLAIRLACVVVGDSALDILKNILSRLNFARWRDAIDRYNTGCSNGFFGGMSAFTGFCILGLLGAFAAPALIASWAVGFTSGGVAIVCGAHDKQQHEKTKRYQGVLEQQFPVLQRLHADQ